MKYTIGLKDPSNEEACQFFVRNKLYKKLLILHSKVLILWNVLQALPLYLAQQNHATEICQIVYNRAFIRC